MKGIKFYLTWEEYEDQGLKLTDKLTAYLDQYNTYDYEYISIGNWEESYEETPKSIIDFMVENKDKFPNLKSIYLGDIDPEECELSWIMHTNASDLVNTFKPERFTVRGANCLRLIDMDGTSLKKLKIVSGGMQRNLIDDLINSDLSGLNHLELYLGVDEYGFDGDIEQIKHFLSREKFPNLKFLGLKNSGIQDEICLAVVESDIIEGLETLDLSLGTMSNKGAQALLDNADKLANLKKLDIIYNYATEDMMYDIDKNLSAHGVKVYIDNSDVDTYDEDDDWRYPFYTE